MWPSSIIVAGVHNVLSVSRPEDSGGDKICTLAGSIFLPIHIFLPAKFGVASATLAFVEYRQVLLDLLGVGQNVIVEIGPLHHYPRSEVVGMIL
jgi:hypothetical protein